MPVKRLRAAQATGDLLDHAGLHPQALTVRAACELLGV